MLETEGGSLGIVAFNTEYIAVDHQSKTQEKSRKDASKKESSYRYTACNHGIHDHVVAGRNQEPFNR
ncbi:hypothetical protein SDC9_146794 [bioreactor metagenome]|uniref:Uncharacterized protein n=1 Tax=bioreactor metagenome TaxID=1076179 RepID=A0A645EG64_9ZZZZ